VRKAQTPAVPEGSVGVSSKLRVPIESAGRSQTSHTLTTVAAISMVVEVEHVKEIAEGRTVERYIRVIVVDNRVREIVPAPLGQRTQMPIPLDELQN
jgi:predicted thioesterase